MMQRTFGNNLMTWYIDHRRATQTVHLPSLITELGYERRSWSTDTEWDRQVAVYRLDLRQASALREVKDLVHKVWRYPVQKSGSDGFLDFEDTPRNILPGFRFRDASPKVRVYEALSEAAEFTETRRRIDFALRLFEVPDIDGYAIWIWHKRESWFLPFGPDQEKSPPISADDFLSEIVYRASTRSDRLRRSNGSVFVGDLPTAAPILTYYLLGHTAGRLTRR